MDRTERQKLCIKRWVKSGGKGSLICATGFGKSRIALTIIQSLVVKNPDLLVLIVVPTEALKVQWIDHLSKWNLLYNCDVKIINTVIKHSYAVDLLILDEEHLFASQSFEKVFQVVQYKLILGLTATLERLDGKEEIIKRYAPPCDEVTIKDAEKNGWVSKFKEYVVLLNVDLTEYNNLNKKFNSYFSYFNFDFNTGMKCLQDLKFRNTYAKQIGLNGKKLATIAADWMRSLRKRKEFIMLHPKKLEIIKKIIEARKDKKIITFSPTIEEAKKIGSKYIIASSQSKALNNKILEEFKNVDKGVICSVKALNTGADIPGLSVEIVANVDSSKITKVQKTGRCIRFEDNKFAEIFTLLIAGTQEINWFRNSSTTDYTVITEKQLDDVLAGKQVGGTKFSSFFDKNKRY